MLNRHISAVLSGIFLAFSLAGGVPVQAETEPITADLVVSCNTACTVEIKPETSEDIAPENTKLTLTSSSNYSGKWQISYSVPRTYKYLVSQKSNDSSVEKNDDSVYEVEVFVEYLDGSNKLGEIITVKKQGSSSKSGEIKFENTLKKKPESKKPESKPAAPTPTPAIGPDVQTGVLGNNIPLAVSILGVGTILAVCAKKRRKSTTPPKS